MIYHLVKEKEYLPFRTEESYLPVHFDKIGFVHCAVEAAVLAVANDYYATIEDKLVNATKGAEKVA